MKCPPSRHIPEAWPLLLSREQLCAYLGISPETLNKVCPIAPVDLGASVVRFNRMQIDLWVAALPPKLRKVQQEAESDMRLQPPAPAALDDLVAEEQRSESLERLRAHMMKGKARGEGQIRSAG